MAELKARFLKAITLEHCCFCIDIKTGSILSGIWTLVAGLLSVSFQLLTLQTVQRLTKIQLEDLPISVKVVHTLAGIQIAVGTVTACLSVLLLWGIYKDNIRLFMPWMVWVATYEVIDIVIFIFYIATRVTIGPQVYVGDVIILLLDLYCVMCVYSYFKKLKNIRSAAPHMAPGLSAYRPVAYRALSREGPSLLV